MSKKITTQAPKIETRPIAEKAYRAAFEIRSGLKSYTDYRADILDKLNNASRDVEQYCEYGTISERAGNIVTQISRLTQNMRLDLLVKYAAKAEIGQAVLDAIKDQLTEEEQARVDQIIGS